MAAQALPEVTTIQHVAEPGRFSARLAIADLLLAGGDGQPGAVSKVGYPMLDAGRMASPFTTELDRDKRDPVLTGAQRVVEGDRLGLSIHLPVGDQLVAADVVGPGHVWAFWVLEFSTIKPRDHRVFPTRRESSAMSGSPKECGFGGVTLETRLAADVGCNARFSGVRDSSLGQSPHKWPRR
jgi:hypothetical protein